MHRRKLLFSIVLGLGLGCSSATEDRYGSIDAYAEARAEAECEGVAMACGADEGACVQARKAFWIADASTHPGRVYTSRRTEECIEVWRTAHSDRMLTIDELDPKWENSAADICERVFQGTVQDRQSCTNDYECEEDRYCDVVGALTPDPPRRCSDRIERRKGEGCANLGEECEKGAYCGSDQGLPTCIAKQADGQACGVDRPCAEDYRCDNGTCRARFTVGWECQSNDDCASSAPLCLEVSGRKQCLGALTFGTGSPACKGYGL